MGDVSDAFAWYAGWAEDVSPLYERLARGVAGDPELLDIAAEAPDGQPPPQLLLAAVHAFLLDGREHRLAEFYPSCTDDPSDPTNDDPYPAFREFCLANEGRVRELVTSRRVQTNAVGRSAVLLPAFGYVTGAGTGNRPLALVEVGASAGLNLHWDRFRYEYEGYGVYGVPGSPVRIRSAVRGDVAPPFPNPVPDVGYRVGVDLNPLDVTDPADAHWLRALVVPDQQRRHERLAAAIDLVGGEPSRLVEGDAIAVLPDLLPEAPTGLSLCVFSTHTLYQLDREEVAELEECLVEYSHERPVHWLSGDPSRDTDYPVYRYVALRDGAREETRLVEYESYGEWVRWLATMEE